ncbi:hypothetical protein BXQ17_10420 [Polaribacter sp. BM10]|uniref:hypothetical protein n=1 Tax=Polaribacter sp. BM10 TaxID=1529069 RepID=UPI00098B91C5|nr:hypothetical protein [Polaribacter sp. BM10]AQS94453.1 hypothetical protein BXQ17_10420 [Polaribacter sp. BM10]
MKKQILNIGKALNRAEQKQVFGGATLAAEGSCAVRINGSVWTGLSLSRINEVKKNMSAGDSVQWCCDGCSTASWLN